MRSSRCLQRLVSSRQAADSLLLVQLRLFDVEVVHLREDRKLRRIRGDPPHHRRLTFLEPSYSSCPLIALIPFDELECARGVRKPVARDLRN